MRKDNNKSSLDIAFDENPLSNNDKENIDASKIDETSAKNSMEEQA